MKSAYALRRWLAWEVLGKKIPRKPPEKASVLHPNKPARNYRYRAWIRSLPCARCGLEPAGEAAHTGEDGGMRQKPSDYSCVPLCAECHRLRADAYHRIGKQEFERRNGIDFRSLVQRLNRIWFHPANQP